VLDGTDNLQTRYLINDACLKTGVPWIYSGVVGVSGMTMGILPGETACIQCLFPHAPAPGASETCDVAGVLSPAAYAVASIAAAEAIKLLSGETFTPGLLAADLWRGTWDRIEIARNPTCPACGLGELNYLEGEDWGRDAARLCGRDAIQIRLSTQAPDFDALAEHWRASGVGEVLANSYVVRLRTGKHELTVFPDSRVIVKGTEDTGVARGLVARYIGV
jgi:molybdopterin-synthase adenylyltransferase